MSDEHAGTPAPRWRVQWQDFTGWRSAEPRQPHPPRLSRDFDTEAEARGFLDAIRGAAPALVGQVDVVRPRPRKETKATLAGLGFERRGARAEKRLTE